MPMYALTKVLYNVLKIMSGNIIIYHYLVDHIVILKKVSCMLSIVVGKWDEAMQHYAGNENFRSYGDLYRLLHIFRGLWRVWKI